MRTMALALNSIVVAFFSCFLVYTFVARAHLDALARDFVTEKTISYSKPIVEIAHESIDSPLVRKLLSEDNALAIRNSIAWFSFLIFVAVLYCSFLYIDDLTFFRILFRTHMGWLYPMLLCIMTFALYWDFGRHTKAAEQSDANETPENATSSERSAPAISGTPRQSWTS